MPETTQDNIDKGLSPSPRLEIKIPDFAGNRTQAAGLEGRDSTDHAKNDVLDSIYCIFKILATRLHDNV